MSGYCAQTVIIVIMENLKTQEDFVSNAKKKG